MRSLTRDLLLMTLLGLSPVSLVHAVQVTKQTDSYGRDYFLFTPDKIDPARTYWLVVEGGGFQGMTNQSSAGCPEGFSPDPRIEPEYQGNTRYWTTTGYDRGPWLPTGAGRLTTKNSPSHSSTLS